MGEFTKLEDYYTNLLELIINSLKQNFTEKIKHIKKVNNYSDFIRVVNIDDMKKFIKVNGIGVSGVSGFDFLEKIIFVNKKLNDLKDCKTVFENISSITDNLIFEPSKEEQQSKNHINPNKLFSEKDSKQYFELSRLNKHLVILNIPNKNHLNTKQVYIELFKNLENKKIKSSFCLLIKKIIILNQLKKLLMILTI